MPRTLLDQHLTELRDDVLDLASRAEQAIRLAIDSLRRRDLGLAREIVQGDYEINRRRFAIEERAVNLIATQQPAATDLRAIIAVIHIVTEIERIADHAEGIAVLDMNNDGRPDLASGAYWYENPGPEGGVWKRKHYRTVEYITADNSTEFVSDCGAGVVDVKSFYPESPEDVAVNIRAILEHVRPEKLYVNPDCGFGWSPRNMCNGKIKALAEGARIVRGELNGTRA